MTGRLARLYLSGFLLISAEPLVNGLQPMCFDICVILPHVVRDSREASRFGQLIF